MTLNSSKPDNGHEYRYRVREGVEFMYSWRGAEGDSIGFVKEAGDVFRDQRLLQVYVSPLAADFPIDFLAI